MGKQRLPIQIRKIPLSRQVQRPTQSFFPRMPKLYLELLENKEKIKQNLVNQEYVPPVSNFVKPDLSLSLLEPLKETPETEVTKINKDDDSHSESSGKISVISSGSENSSNDTDDDILGDDDDSNSNSNEDEDEVIQYVKPKPKKPFRNLTPFHFEDYDSQDETERKESSPNYFEQQNKYNQSLPSPPNFNNPLHNNNNFNNPPPPSTKPNDSIQNILGTNSDVPLKPTVPQTAFQRPPPALSELGMMKRTVPNLNYMETNPEEENLKRELLWKFDSLKRSYNIEIPEYSVHSDYTTMKRSHDNLLKRVSIDNSVENYKKILFCSFYGLEYILGKYLKLDMNGFAQSQVISMVTYDRLLIELGEKSYIADEEQWPVEIRLAGLVLGNCALFCLCRLIEKNPMADTKSTGGLFNIVNSFMQTFGGNSNNNLQKEAKKMRGPNIDLSQMEQL